MWCLPVVTRLALHTQEGHVSSCLSSKTVWSRRQRETAGMDLCVTAAKPVWILIAWNHLETRDDLSDLTLVWKYNLAADAWLEVDFEELKGAWKCLRDRDAGEFLQLVWGVQSMLIYFFNSKELNNKGLMIYQGNYQSNLWLLKLNSVLLLLTFPSILNGFFFIFGWALVSH